LIRINVGNTFKGKYSFIRPARFESRQALEKVEFRIPFKVKQTGLAQSIGLIVLSLGIMAFI